MNFYLYLCIMANKTFQHYIDISICDFSITYFDKNQRHSSKGFSSYKGFCNYMHGEVKAKRYKNYLSIITSIMGNLQSLTGFSKQECVAHITKFFLEKKWERYERPLRQYRSYFNKFL
jgi:hypothetical protein